MLLLNKRHNTTQHHATQKQTQTAAAFSPAAIKKYGVSKNATLFSPYCHQPPASLQASDDVTCIDLGDIPTVRAAPHADSKQTKTHTRPKKQQPTQTTASST